MKRLDFLDTTQAINPDQGTEDSILAMQNQIYLFCHPCQYDPGEVAYPLMR